jgi:hypothetical protein
MRLRIAQKRAPRQKLTREYIVLKPKPRQVTEDTYQLWIDLINDLATQKNREGPFSSIYDNLLSYCCKLELQACK